MPLAEILDRAGVRPDAREVRVPRRRPRRRGRVEPAPSASSAASRSTTPATASVLLAYAMNGEPLPVQHGYPLRLVVPGWYGVASVKWLTEIEVIDRPFEGYYQTDRYVYERERRRQWSREPVTLSNGFAR